MRGCFWLQDQTRGGPEWLVSSGCPEKSEEEKDIREAVSQCCKTAAEGWVTCHWHVALGPFRCASCPQSLWRTRAAQPPQPVQARVPRDKHRNIPWSMGRKLPEHPPSSQSTLPAPSAEAGPRAWGSVPESALLGPTAPPLWSAAIPPL